MRRRILIPGLLLLLLTAPAVRAELVIFEEGSVLKVAAYQVRDDEVDLTLPVGGVLTVALSRIDRVVDDEIVLDPVSVQASMDNPPLPVRFADGQPVPATPWGEQIYAAARRHALNPALVAAVVRAESAFDPRAVSHKGARGLMQLMPATARRFGLGEHEIFDPAKNLEAGSRYLSWLLERFGDDLVQALAAYNAGEGTVQRYGGVPPYRETRSYLRRIYGTLGLDLTL